MGERRVRTGHGSGAAGWIGSIAAAGAAALIPATAALANLPQNGQLGLMPPATVKMELIHEFHDYWLVPMIFAISILVLALLVWVVIRYNSRMNPNPQKFHHNTVIEVVWTVIPVAILIAIAFPSFRLLYFNDVIPDGRTAVNGQTIPAPEMTINVYGYQWYWGYSYPDQEIGEYVSTMLFENETTPELYRFAVDQPVVAPSDTTVRLLVTAADVIHNWAMPSFGIKTDAIPGRTNETWFHVPADKEGTYYGQCSELCGLKHAFMPIQVEIVPREVFERWARAKAAGDDTRAGQIVADWKDDGATTRLASAE